MLPESDRQELERILMRDIPALTESDIAFLNARREYLTGEQRQTYASVLRDSVEVLEPVAPVDPVQPTVEAVQTEQPEVNFQGTEANPYDVDPSTIV